MNRKTIEETVEQLVEDIIDGMDLEIVDVEYVRERDWYLRVFLDKETGIELDDCQWVSERLEENLDRLDLIKEQYYLEISSPGLDRQLKKEKDFIRHSGDMVEINLYRSVEGVKNIVGRLICLKDGVIHLKDILPTGKGAQKGQKGKKTVEPARAEAEELKIPWDEVASVRLYIDF